MTAAVTYLAGWRAIEVIAGEYGVACGTVRAQIQEDLAKNPSNGSVDQAGTHAGGQASGPLQPGRHRARWGDEAARGPARLGQDPGRLKARRGRRPELGDAALASAHERWRAWPYPTAEVVPGAPLWVRLFSVAGRRHCCRRGSPDCSHRARVDEDLAACRENLARAAAASDARLAVATRQAIGKLIASADLLRSGRTADAANLLRGMTADLDRLKDLSRQFRELANREHDRCVPLVKDLETKTNNMYQEQKGSRARSRR